MQQDLNDILSGKSINQLYEVQRHILSIIQAKMKDEEMYNLLQEFSKTSSEPTLDNKVNFLLKKERKLKAVMLVKQEKNIGLKDAKSIVDRFIPFGWGNPPKESQVE